MRIGESRYDIANTNIFFDNCEKGDHQAVGCYHQGNVSGPVGKLGRGLLEASNIQTNTFTFNLR